MRQGETLSEERGRQKSSRRQEERVKQNAEPVSKSQDAHCRKVSQVELLEELWKNAGDLNPKQEMLSRRVEQWLLWWRCVQ